MKTSFGASLLTACLLAAPAIAQTSTSGPSFMLAQNPPALAPPLGASYAPATPLTAADTRFVEGQLSGNLAEIKAGQLALQISKDQAVRDFAQRMITDHTAANDTLMPIAQRHNIAMPTGLKPAQQRMVDRLGQLTGLQFDRAYIDGMVRAHDTELTRLNNQLTNGQNQQINAWVQNTRPLILQHVKMAQEIKGNLPRTTG